MNQFQIGDEVVVYARGRIRAMEEENVWDSNLKQYVRVIRYSVDYPNTAGTARVTGEVIERKEVSA